MLRGAQHKSEYLKPHSVAEEANTHMHQVAVAQVTIKFSGGQQSSTAVTYSD